MTCRRDARIGFLLLLPLLLLFRVFEFDIDDTDAVNEERRLVEFALTGGTLTGVLLCCSFIRLFLLAPDIIAVLFVLYLNSSLTRQSLTLFNLSLSYILDILLPSYISL